MKLLRRAFLSLGLLSLVAGCEDPGKKSAELSKEQVVFLAEAARKDVDEVRRGLPNGAGLLAPVLSEAHPEVPSFEKARTALDKARDKTDDLRSAKSTFFALVMPDGRIVRRDGKTDSMAGKSLYEFYPELRQALEKDYVESRGSMPEASGLRGKSDEQWVAASPIKSDGKTLGLYVTGWSWSAYAYRLEVALRSKILGAAKLGDKVPLTYVYVLAYGKAYGAPISPELNGKKLVEAKVLEKAKGTEIVSAPLDIDGRSFGFSAIRVPELGKDVAIVVLRSET